MTAQTRPLSPRELEAVRAIAAGASVKSGARDLGISPETFKDYTSRVRLKMGAATNAQAAATAAKMGLL